jgi:hypothetical protein
MKIFTEKSNLLSMNVFFENLISLSSLEDLILFLFGNSSILAKQTALIMDLWLSYGTKVSYGTS